MHHAHPLIGEGGLPWQALDRLKEQLAYFKFWQGIMVVTDIGLVGWLISTAADTSKGVTFALAVVGVASLKPSPPL